VEVVGVNSTLRDGSHVIFWDFDNTTLADVKDALLLVQKRLDSK